MRLENQKVVVIGGSSGLGLASALAAESEGAKIVIAGRSQEKLDAASKLFKSKIETIPLDLSDEKAIGSFFNKIGNFNHLVVTGGVTKPGSILELDAKTVRDSFESKFWGQYFSAKYAIPHLAKNGSIVFFSGVFGMRPRPNTAVLTAVNGAIEGLTRALAVEIAPIRVNVIAPGFIKTERIANMPEKNKQEIEKLIAELPLKKSGIPENVAQSVLYLLTNDYATGSTLCIDGGYSLH